MNQYKNPLKYMYWSVCCVCVCVCLCVRVLVCVDYFASLWDNTFNSFIFTLSFPPYPSPSFIVGQIYQPSFLKIIIFLSFLTFPAQ